MTRRGIFLLACAGTVAAATVLATLLVLAECHYIYFNRRNLPDLGPFTRFEFSTIGHVYDAGGTPIIELAREYRELARYEDIPSIVRDAILAAEDKRFFSHTGIATTSACRASWGRSGSACWRAGSSEAAVTTRPTAQRSSRKAGRRLPNSSCAAYSSVL